ncbi:MAG: hypothetical protein LBS51_07000 [Oscillospiraceae bacterium]|nr:hypothetical protein [Oscillospiraceae bacterium]
MKYPRPAYLDPRVPLERKRQVFGNSFTELPRFETPITPSENFKRAASRDNPLWVPNALTDFQTIMAQDVIYGEPDGVHIHTDFRDDRNAVRDYVFTDWFNTSWTWVASAGGAMLTPGTRLVEDITEWEKTVKWPVLSEWDFKSKAVDYMRQEYDPDKMMHYDIGRGCTERLISIVGGYTEGMLALAMEPEAVKAFIDRYADFVIDLFDAIYALYPLDMVTYHDDWGTERDTFFSERMLEELVFEPTKRIIEHVKATGAAFELHSCGNITRFLPYMAEMGADFVQIQRRAVDIPAAKARYGDRIGFNTGIEGLPPDHAPAAEELIKMVRNTVTLYGAGGGFYASVHSQDPKTRWEILAELYAYSREYYESFGR